MGAIKHILFIMMNNCSSNYLNIDVVMMHIIIWPYRELVVDCRQLK